MSSSTGGEIRCRSATSLERVAGGGADLGEPPGSTSPERSARRISTLSAATSQLSGSRDLEPAAALADLREQLNDFFGQRVGVGLDSARAGRAGRSSPPSRPRRRPAAPGGLAPVVALEPGGEVAPQRRAALGVGDGLAVDPKAARRLARR